jgi:ribosomal protein S18 acetylase RimI-like enzyme
MPFRDKIGALALAVVEGSTTEIILNSVLPELQGRGLYIQLLEMVEYRTLEIGGSMVRISTQSTNIRVINALIKAGYRLENSFLTLHIRPMTKLAK